MKLNGWLRLWLLVSTIYVLIVGGGFLALGMTSDMNATQILLAGSIVILGPPVLLYLLGRGVAWVVRGFTQ